MHPKAEGAPITIALPLSWSKRESTHDGVVQVFRNGAGNGPILCTIYCKKVLDDSDGDFTPEEMRELFSESFIKETIPEGATFIEGRSMIIAGQTGAMQIRRPGMKHGVNFDSLAMMTSEEIRKRSKKLLTVNLEMLIEPCGCYTKDSVN